MEDKDMLNKAIDVMFYVSLVLVSVIAALISGPLYPYVDVLKPVLIMSYVVFMLTGIYVIAQRD
jgi:hypothetical protein